MKQLKSIAPVVAALVLAACTAQETPDSATQVLAVGDSVMSWNSSIGAAIPDVIEDRTGLSVADRSVPGARLVNPDPAAAAKGYDIRAQYVPGDWSWVVVNGGANDLINSCDCAACDDDLDALLSRDGQAGVMADLVRVMGARSRVLVMGYSDPWAGGNAFSDCADELEELGRRQALLADASPRVFYSDAGEVLDSRDPDHWFVDRVHPSPKGSSLIGTLLAATMTEADR